MLEISGEFRNVLLENNGEDEHIRNEKVLHIDKKERNILQTIKERQANWIGHILSMNCFVKDIIEGKVERRTEVTEWRAVRSKQLQDDFKGKRG